MKHAKYNFITTFCVKASVEEVFAVLIAYNKWQTWWKGLNDLEVIKDARVPKGYKLALALGPGFYNLHFTLTLDSISINKSISLNSSGDLQGVGTFTLSQKEDSTVVTFIWNVETTKFWMNLVEPIGRPIFVFEHNVIMKWFAQGLANYLQKELLYIHNN
jgi:hypothetical protein